MMTFKNYFLTAALMMMLAACSGNYDTPSGDTPVPTESYETVLNYFKEINAVPRPSRHDPSMQIITFGPNVYDGHTINEHVEISSIEHTWQYTIELLKNIK